MDVARFLWEFWRKSVTKTTKLARDFGLNAYVDLWGWGKTLAGEPPSIILSTKILLSFFALLKMSYNRFPIKINKGRLGFSCRFLKCDDTGQSLTHEKLNEGSPSRTNIRHFL